MVALVKITNMNLTMIVRACCYLASMALKKWADRASTVVYFAFNWWLMLSSTNSWWSWWNQPPCPNWWQIFHQAFKERDYNLEILRQPWRILLWIIRSDNSPYDRTHFQRTRDFIVYSNLLLLSLIIHRGSFRIL